MFLKYVWASQRVRAALRYKNIEFEEIGINLGDKSEGGDWHHYKMNINPMGFVPAIRFPDSEKVRWVD